MIALRPIKETLSICKVPDYSLVDLCKPYCFTGCTPDEKSLVCRTEDVPSNATSKDDGWTVFMIEGILDFSLIGILSRIAGTLADAGIGIFAISTYNTDYILVKDENRTRAEKALRKAGYIIKD